MRITRALINDFGPIRSFESNFVRDNCIVGMNGCGKTTLLRLMGGVCGIDSSTQLLDGHPVGRCEIVVNADGKDFVFTAKHKFDGNKIDKFKKSLPKRVNFPLTEWIEAFPSNCVDIATAKWRWEQFVRTHRGTLPDTQDFYYSPDNRSVRFLSGDGYKHAMSLLLMDSKPGTPVLLDSPGRHMDLTAKRIIVDFLTNQSRQLFYTTHCPEMLSPIMSRDTNGNQQIIDMS